MGRDVTVLFCVGDGIYFYVVYNVCMVLFLLLFAFNICTVFLLLVHNLEMQLLSVFLVSWSRYCI